MAAVGLMALVQFIVGAAVYAIAYNAGVSETMKIVRPGWIKPSGKNKKRQTWLDLHKARQPLKAHE